MNPVRFQSFALAYAPAIRQAAVRSGVFLAPGETVEDYALQTTIAMLDQIEAKGLKAVQNYYLNNYGGAFLAVGAELGIAGTAEGVQKYLDGG